jgi:hypothetical protein
LTPRGNKLSVPFQPPRPADQSEFLGAAGFCQIWIPNYSLLAKPLCKATKGGKMEPLSLKRGKKKAFRKIKRALTYAPALGLLDVMKPFFL